MVLGGGSLLVYIAIVLVVSNNLCRTCGLDLSTCKRYERCLLSRQANVLSVLSLLLEELGIVLDVSGYLRDWFIRHTAAWVPTERT